MIVAVDELNARDFSDPAVLATDHGIITGANHQALQLFGYTRNEMVGENLRMLMPTAVAEHHDKFLSHYRKHRDRRLIGKTRVVSIRRKDGSEPQCTIRLGEYMVGSELCFVGVFSDDPGESSGVATDGVETWQEFDEQTDPFVEEDERCQ